MLRNSLSFVRRSNRPAIIIADFNTGTKGSPPQHLDNNFVGSLPSYVSSPTHNMTQVVQNKTAEMQYSHYVMPAPPVEYNSPNLPMWDHTQITPTVHNNVPNNNKKVNHFLIINRLVISLTKDFIILCSSDRWLRHWRCCCIVEWK